MTPMEEYASKRRTAEEAVEVVRSGQWVDYAMGLGQPIALDRALAARRGDLRNVKVRGALALRPLQVVEADPQGESFTYSSWHFSGYERRLHDQGHCHYIPMIYRRKPMHYRKTLESDVVMLSVAPMDRHGFFSFSLTNSATRAQVERAKTVLVEVNRRLPRSLGGREEHVHLSEVTFVVEGDDPELATLTPPAPTEVDRRVARLIVEEIESRSTIQLGIGGLPNTVGRMLAESDVQDLGMHTEMLVDAYLELHRRGKLTNARKNVDRGKGVWTFCVGSRELYDWVDENPGLACYPVDYTNAPDVMARNERMVTINSAVEIDLFGQISAESSGPRQISGTGGQLDFLTGAYLSEQGKAFVCLPSTYQDKRTGRVQSRIVPTLPAGGIVTDPRTQAHWVVTEWGKVNLAGRSTWERAERLISIAHPDFREDLVQAAERLNIWRGRRPR
jgi:butyryl-CoA:acetate CoA-transferase